ncbi:unnamed protein product [Calypogeia fissa]
MASTMLVCATLVGKTVDEMVEKIGQAKNAGADLVEFRIDYITDFNAKRDLPTLLKARTLPAIVTYRPKWEGGLYEGDEAPRLAALQLAADLGADYVDVELKAATESFPSRKRKNGTKFIVSNHNYELTPSIEDLEALAAKCVSAGADIVKIVTTAHDIIDNARMFQLMTRSTVPIITLVMGQKGEISRILTAKYGGFLTFGTLGKGQESAPGQHTLEQLIKVYRVKQIGRDTKVYGLVGNPVSHSKAPLFHNAVYNHEGMNCVYVYFMVDDLPSFLNAFGSQDFAGYSVTLPHKETAAKICDDLEESARQIGAVNTLVRKKNMKFSGYNTDCVGALKSIEDGLRAGGLHTTQEQPLQGKTFVVIGAGGAGKALAFGAYARGAKVIVANRTIARAQALADQLGPNASAITMDQLDEMKASKGFIVANSTSVGMLPDVDASPIAAQALKGYELAFDAIYTPRVTKFLREAGERGVTIVDGVEMFIEQAIVQFELLTGTTSPVQYMRQLVESY